MAFHTQYGILVVMLLELYHCSMSNYISTHSKLNTILALVAAVVGANFTSLFECYWYYFSRGKHYTKEKYCIVHKIACTVSEKVMQYG